MPYRVLVVDDESLILKAVKRTLRRAFLVEVAEGPEKALQLLEKHSFDIVLSDHDMPLHNGIWLLRQIQTRFPAMRRVLMSGGSPPKLEEQVRSGLVQAFVAKPFENDVLSLTLLGAVRPRRAE